MLPDWFSAGAAVALGCALVNCVAGLLSQKMAAGAAKQQKPPKGSKFAATEQADKLSPKEKEAEKEDTQQQQQTEPEFKQVCLGGTCHSAQE